MACERNPGWNGGARIFPGFHFAASGLRVWISASTGTTETHLWGLNGAVEAISTLAADAALGTRFGGNAGVYAKEYLDRDAIRSRFERRLEDLVGGRAF